MPPCQNHNTKPPHFPTHPLARALRHSTSQSVAHPARIHQRHSQIRQHPGPKHKQPRNPLLITTLITITTHSRPGAWYAQTEHHRPPSSHRAYAQQRWLEARHVRAPLGNTWCVRLILVPIKVNRYTFAFRGGHGLNLSLNKFYEVLGFSDTTTLFHSNIYPVRRTPPSANTIDHFADGGSTLSPNVHWEVSSDVYR